MNTSSNLKMFVAAGLSLVLTSFADGTKGIGKYPGSPAENFAPEMVPDNTYRNVALNRAVRTSSQYDNNLTAQLITDGIVDTTAPQFLIATTNSGLMPRREREWCFDGNIYSRNTITGEKAWIDYTWNNMAVAATRVKILCTVAYHEELATGGYVVSVQTSRGKKQRTLASVKGAGLPGKELKYKVHSDPNKQTGPATLPTRRVEIDMQLSKGAKVTFNDLRVDFDMPGAAYWTISEISILNGDKAVDDIFASGKFTSAWMSDGGGEQWAQVDLGRATTIDRVSLDWIEKAVKGSVEVSADGKAWRSVAALPGGKRLTDDISFVATQARYVRVMMTQPTSTGRYIMSEMKVMGHGGLTAKPHSIAGMQNGRYLLDGGNWQLARASQVSATGDQISKEDYDTNQWITATVPGTVLTSYVNVGALPDPNISDNLYSASESFFNSNFWYRTEFDVPAELAGRHIFLNLDGINWKANVWLNGKKVTRVEGAFMRGKADVTSLLTKGRNVLAVEIIKNAHPGTVKEKNRQNTGINGGLLGYDNPTFHATIGWDWITTVRGRDIGIWNDIALTAADAVSLKDPLVTSVLALPDTTASMTPAIIVANNESHEVSGTLRGWIGRIRFEKTITIAASSEKEIKFAPEEFAQLRSQKMNLWWPNGYGTPYLYDAGFEFVQDGIVSDAVSYKAGIRQMEYRDVDTRLTMYVNGQRFIPLGGNWGFSEANLNYRGREYDIAVKYHRDMNFNIIRNWVGQTGDEEFYEACDKYGIMVWQDFWLANPADGPDPMDEDMFNANAYDYTLRMRNHPSIGIYCGRNEGYPPATIDKKLREYVAALNPGLGYISSSADDGVSGHGPYWALPAKEYFERQTGKLHSERGMPNVMTYEGLRRTFSEKELWPQGDAWGQHDYTMEGAQRGASFNGIISKAFGDNISNAEEFGTLAQWINYDGYRAMYESGSRDRMGLLIWMSHACWPSMTWQCYDYYFEPTAAFFGCKKACEPLHIQFNPSTRNVEVVNLCAGEHENMTAVLTLRDVNGKYIESAGAPVSCKSDTTVVLPQLNVRADFAPEHGKVYFVQLSLQNAKGEQLSDNFYIQSTEEGNWQELNSLPRLDGNAIKTTLTGKGTSRTIEIENTSATPAMMLRLNLKAADGEQILPVDYSDNYFHLMPGEKKTLTIGWNDGDARSQLPELWISGFNVDAYRVGI